MIRLKKLKLVTYWWLGTMKRNLMQTEKMAPLSSGKFHQLPKPRAAASSLNLSPATEIISRKNFN
jgi:hypothetical protein